MQTAIRSGPPPRGPRARPRSAIRPERRDDLGPAREPRATAELDRAGARAPAAARCPRSRCGSCARRRPRHVRPRHPPRRGPVATPSTSSASPVIRSRRWKQAPSRTPPSRAPGGQRRGQRRLEPDDQIGGVLTASGNLRCRIRADGLLRVARDRGRRAGARGARRAGRRRGLRDATALPSPRLYSLLGAVLRLTGADQSLFGDELSTYWIVSTNDLPGVALVRARPIEITPPLYFVLAVARDADRPRRPSCCARRRWSPGRGDPARLLPRAAHRRSRGRRSSPRR